MEIILVSGCVLYFLVLIFWAITQARKRQHEHNKAWDEYSSVLIELAKNPKSNELLQKAKSLGEKYYQYKIPDSYGPEIYAPIHPLTDAIPPWDRTSASFIDNSNAREEALKKDIELKCSEALKGKKAA
jgi:hypothetical protein